jgi:hypothetical protein
VPDPNPNFDTCDGGQGSDTAFGCESVTEIETILGA